MLAGVGLAKLNPGDFGDRIGLIRGLKRPGQERVFRNGLWRKLGINAGTAEKNQFAHLVPVRRANDIVLQGDVFEQKFDRVIIVRLDSADLGRGQDHNAWLLVPKEFRHGRFVGEIQLRAGASNKIRETAVREGAEERASYQASMTGDKYLFGLFHQVTFSIFFFPALRNREFVAKAQNRLPVQKTYKLFIGGKFVRGENGRVLPARGTGGTLLANYCRASRKDFRDAVTSARSAFAGWAKQSAYLRSQILYRAAEMLEMRQNELVSEVARANGASPAQARTEATLAVDRLVHYAGWTDKFAQVFGSVNPVASSHFNFTTPEPTGVVVVVCPDEPPLLAFVSLITPVILAGNTVIVLASTTKPLPALTFSEIIATSDLPGGVVNILAGDRAELAPHIAGHMDVNAIVDASGEEKIGRELQRGGGLNVKRYVRRDLAVDAWKTPAAEDPYWILDTVEMKTAWHPIGL